FALGLLRLLDHPLEFRLGDGGDRLDATRLRFVDADVSQGRIVRLCPIAPPLDPCPHALKLERSFDSVNDMPPPPGQVPGPVARAAAGDRAAVAELLERYRARLRRMVAIRLDPRLRGRVDASDVIQEGYLEALRRLDEFIRNPCVPFYIWLRSRVGQRVHDE